MKPEESAELEFKASFDPKGDWCELIKDIVAIANAGGGEIRIGVNDDGSLSGADIAPILSVDLADVINKIRGFTDVNFAGIKITSSNEDGQQVASSMIARAPTPFVFSKSGNYVAPNGKQKSAFGQGTFYVRHGPKSEPATSDDLRSIIERLVSQQREHLMANLRQVIEAPADSVVRIATPQEAAQEDGKHLQVRLVTDDNAETAKLIDPNKTHPYRQKEVVETVNKRLDGKYRFTSNDNVAARRIFGLEQRAEFYYRPKYGSGQYSDAYVDHLVKQILEDPNYLENLRQSFHRLVVHLNAKRKQAK